jgi:hypothetical protein
MPLRLENLLHYIIAVTPPEQLGATKLAKIVWFSDVENYRVYRTSITKSDGYRRRDQGPWHIDFNRSLESLKEAGKISERAVQTPAGVRREFVWLAPPSVDDFTGPEIAIVHNVIGAILPLSATEASDISHSEPWLSAYDRESLPISAAAVVWGDVDDEDMKWAESVASEHSATT